jgi:hypothetical protein
MRVYTVDVADIVVTLCLDAKLAAPPKLVALDVRVSSYRGRESGVPDPADQPTPEQNRSIPETTPDGTRLAPIYDRVRELADVHLIRPVTITVDTYEDDTVRIQAKHHIPPDGEEILYYHSDDQTVRYAVQLEGGLKEERVVAELDVPDRDTTT